jgi:S-adenosyl methyltransferase
MSDRPAWASADVDITVPSPARMYDYLLGGAHNFAVDRELADKAIPLIPNLRQMALRNRAFLRRAVLTLVDAGVRQFLDLGSGIPTAGNVHEVAQRAAPESRVVYVDVDPVAVAHSELVLEGNDRATAILADMRDPAGVLEHPKTRQMLDFDAPIGLLLVTIFHYIADSEGPRDLLARYRDPLVRGSYLALSHITPDLNAAALATMIQVGMKSVPFYPRTHAEITELFTGFELLDPGLVATGEWRAHPADDGGDPKDDVMFAGVGIKC